ncbi:MFS transporter [Limosilactobacillus panis]|uniref:MFS transporter n=1 Tax=Limosilactobacillus panis TaxID=47493 RepID=UPI001C98A72C|nr:MFS transporter [Limosilactobacillus panis]QZN93244.1 MFS transporter [Limosilactobacillus panis]
MEKQSEKIQGWMVLAVIAAGVMSFAGVVVETAVNISFPTLMREFKISTDLVQWMTTICLLTVSLTVPLSAYLKRRFKTKHLFVFANLTFTVGLLIDILAPNFWLLLVGRLVQGIGTGVALPLMFNIILDWVPQRRVGMMMGLGTMITGIAPAVGPTYGGLLVNSLGWRWIFIFLLPLLVLSLITGMVTIRQKGRLMKTEFDWLSLVTLILMFAGLTTGFANMGSQPLLSWLVLGSFAIGLIGTIAFITRSLKITSPIVNLTLFARHRFARLAFAFLLFQLTALGLSFLVPNYIQLVNHGSAMLAGLIVLPGAALGAVTGPFGGRLLDQFGARKPVLSGVVLNLIAVIGLTCLATGRLTNSTIIFLYIAFMVGAGLSFGNIMTSALASLPDQSNGDGNAILNTLQQFAGAVGTSIASTIVAASQANHDRPLDQATAMGTQHALLVLLVALLLELALVYWTLPKDNR